MMKDNFSNPNPFLNQAKQFQELVNQPTAGDAMADANIRSMIPNPRNEGEILANSLSSGFAGGLKAHENQKRQDKLSPMLERAGQITAKAAELEAQMQDETQTKLDVEKFYRRVAPAMLERSKAALARDTSAVSELDKYIYGILQQSVNDPSLGNYSHSNGGDTFFTNNETGVTEGRNLMNAMYQYGIDPAQIFGKDALNAEIGYSPGAKLKYEDERKMLAAELGIKQSTANVNNAHADNFKAQAEKTKHEIKNPPMSPAQIKTKEINEGRFATRHDNTEEKRILNNAYSQYQDNILDAKKKGLTGKSKPAEWKRYWAEVTGQSENMDIEEMLRITHANRVKELGGSNANMKQFEVAMDSAPSIKKDPDATIKFLDDIIAKNNEFIEETDHLGQIWEQNQYQGQERAILNDFRSQKKPIQSNSGQAGSANNNGMVNMTNSFGQIFQIPADQVEAALHDEEEPLTLVK
jgi:hypothetical protein